MKLTLTALSLLINSPISACDYITSPAHTITTTLNAPFGISFSPDGKTIAVSNVGSCAGGSIQFYSIHAGSYTLANKISNVKPLGIAFSPDGSYLVAAGFFGANLFSLSDWETSQRPTPMPDTTPSTGVAVLGDDCLLSGGYVGSDYSPYVKIYKRLKSKSIPIQRACDLENMKAFRAPLGVAISPDQSCLAVSDFFDNKINLYRYKGSKGKKKLCQSIAIEGPNLIAFSPKVDGKNSYLAIASRTALHLYTIRNCKVLGEPKQIDFEKSVPQGVAFSPDGDCLAVTTQSADSIRFFVRLNPRVTGPSVVKLGSVATLTADLSPFEDNTSASNLTYQWQLDGKDIPGATGNYLELTSLTKTGSYTYNVRVTDSGSKPHTVVLSPHFIVTVN